MEGKAERGAIAEESIGALLDTLPGDNLVLHDVQSRFGNIDHIIISRTKGIILVETKSHHGTVTAEGVNLLINGKPPEKDFIKQTLSNCYWLKEWVKENLGLDVWVNCVSRQTVWRLVQEGVLTKVTIKGSSRYRRSDIVNLIIKGT